MGKVSPRKVLGSKEEKRVPQSPSLGCDWTFLLVVSLSYCVIVSSWLLMAAFWEGGGEFGLPVFLSSVLLVFWSFDL